MRGGTSKGLFLLQEALAACAPHPAERDRLLAQLLGSPDPYGKQINGLGGGYSSTSKVMLLARSQQADCDIDYWFGQVDVVSGRIDWSGNCGNLTAAIGPFALFNQMVTVQHDLYSQAASRQCVRLYCVNTAQRIDAQVALRDGQVHWQGVVGEDGVAQLPVLTAAGHDPTQGVAGVEVMLDFLQPAAEAPLLPTGRACDELSVPELGKLPVTLLQAGNPMVFVRAEKFGLKGKEMPEELAKQGKLLAKLEQVRALAAVKMGLAETASEASRVRPATPKLCLVAPPVTYRSSAGNEISRESVDILARMLSMGKPHHAIAGTASIALAVAAALPGTVVSDVARTLPGLATRIGHPSGITPVEAEVLQEAGQWVAKRVRLARSARLLMSGQTLVM
ncbi:2-methylaconitate cis-trans isomerase PrpF [Parvibium lacunae]|uniref:2-methylaconitate cis-trans isomerase PrpF n=2 Tax=Parvibium lacunae TaxID=1888893 RepID=A0A368L889_9BURK|nr:2-methylaconitate cis-trans isomerase PrpF [Parvibium lacunae]